MNSVKCLICLISFEQSSIKYAIAAIFELFIPILINKTEKRVLNQTIFYNFS